MCKHDGKRTVFLCIRTNIKCRINIFCEKYKRFESISNERRPTRYVCRYIHITTNKNELILRRLLNIKGIEGLHKVSSTEKYKIYLLFRYTVLYISWLVQDQIDELFVMSLGAEVNNNKCRVSNVYTYLGRRNYRYTKVCVSLSAPIG